VGGPAIARELIPRAADAPFPARACGAHVDDNVIRLDAGGALQATDYERSDAVGEGFVRREHLGLLLFADAPSELLDRFAAWQPPTLPRAWLTPSQI